MTSSLSDPTLNRKKRQKLIKQKYDEISEQLNEIKPLLVASSPLNFYWNSTDEERKDITLTELLTKEARSQEDIEGWKNTDGDEIPASVEGRFLAIKKSAIGSDEQYEEMLSKWLRIWDRTSEEWLTGRTSLSLYLKVKEFHGWMKKGEN